MATSYPFANNVRAQSDYAQSYPAQNDYNSQDRYEYHDAHDDDHAYGASSQQPYAEQHGHDRSAYGPPELADSRHSHPDGQDEYNEKAAPSSALAAHNAASAPRGGAWGEYDLKEGNHRKSRYGSKQRDSVFSADDRHVFFRRSWPVRTLRTLFCIFIWAIIIIISVVLLIIMFALPPNLALLSINVPVAGDFTVSGSSFSANGSLNLAVSNPNSFSAKINRITANVYDAMLADRVSIGNGSLVDQTIAANDNTTIVFPFDIGIDLSSSGEALIQDVIRQCGIGTSSTTGGTLTALIDVNARVTVLSLGVTVPISRNVTFACPTSQLESIIERLTGANTAAEAAAALGVTSRRRSFILPPTDKTEDTRRRSSGAGADDSEEDEMSKRAGLHLPPHEAVSSDWEINKRELVRQFVEAWLPRGISSTPGSSSGEDPQQRGLEDL